MIHYYLLMLDVLFLSAAISSRGGLRSDYYLGYFLILGYAMHIPSRHYLILINSWIVLCYSFVTYFYTVDGGFSFGRLVIRLSLLLGTMTLLRMTSLRVLDANKEKEIAIQKSVTDNLTGALNRRYLETYLTGKRCERCQYLALLDLDNFKSFNDRYGHLKWDEDETVNLVLERADINLYDGKKNGKDCIVKDR